MLGPIYTYKKFLTLFLAPKIMEILDIKVYLKTLGIGPGLYRKSVLYLLYILLLLLKYQFYK